MGNLNAVRSVAIVSSKSCHFEPSFVDISTDVIDMRIGSGSRRKCFDDSGVESEA